MRSDNMRTSQELDYIPKYRLAARPQRGDEGQHRRLWVTSDAHESDTAITSWWYPVLRNCFSAACY